jgi:hypothetical protein
MAVPPVDLKTSSCGGNVNRVDDLGVPVAYQALPDDAPVYDQSGAPVGHVAHVLADDVAHIFHGLVITMSGAPATHAFADPSQIAGLHERGVVLTVASDQLHDPAEDPVADQALGGDPVREGLRRAMEWLKGPT